MIVLGMKALQMRDLVVCCDGTWHTPDESKAASRRRPKLPSSDTPEKAGYLYCYASDAWQAYGNNRGSVLMTVTRA